MELVRMQCVMREQTRHASLQRTLNLREWHNALAQRALVEDEGSGAPQFDARLARVSSPRHEPAKRDTPRAAQTRAAAWL